MVPCLRALERLRPLLGEVHVYDTGSVDGTIELAERWGCSVERGFWDYDFARARNASMARSQAVWVLIVDADERVSADPERLRRLLESEDVADVLNIPFVHVDETDRVIGHSVYGKIVRRYATRFRGRVHEVVERRDKAPVTSRELRSDVAVVRHVGYATADIRRTKAQRNAEISEIEVREAEQSDDSLRIGEAHYHHSRALQRLGDSDAATRALLRSMNMFVPGSLGSERVMSSLVPVLLEQGRDADAVSAVRTHLGHGGSPHHGRFLLAQIAQAQGRPHRVLEALRGIPDSAAPERDLSPADVLRLRSQALDALGRADEALACCVRAVAQWGDVARMQELLLRVEGQDTRAVAALLAEGELATSDLVIGALVEAGGPGVEIAGHLRRSGA